MDKKSADYERRVHRGTDRLHKECTGELKDVQKDDKLRKKMNRKIKRLTKRQDIT